MIARLLSAALLLAASSPAEASALFKLKVRNSHAPAGIAMGLLTRSGHGGAPTACPPSTGVAGDGAADWTINAAGELTPSGAYGAVKSFGQGVYFGLSCASGGAAIPRVTMVPNVAHVAPNALNDGDGTTQLYQLLRTDNGQPGAIRLGDTIVMRDGVYNASGAAWLLRPRGAYSQGPGAGSRITIRSETVDLSSTDGNLNNRHGAKIGATGINTGTSGNLSLPIDFRYVWFYRNVTTSQPFFDYNTNAGGGVGFYNVRVEAGPAVAAPPPGLDLNRDETVENSTFHRLGKALTTIAGGLTARRNRFFENYDDTISVACGGHTIEFNFFVDFRWTAGNHPDAIQHNPTSTCAESNPYSIGVVRYNVAARGVGTPGYIDAQGFFARNQTQSESYADTSAHNNVFALTMGNMFWLSTQTNPSYRFNTALADVEAQPVLTDDPPASSPNAFIVIDRNLDGTLTNGGTGYANGNYGCTPAAGVALTGGGGSGMTACLTVAGGSVTAFTIRDQGTGYAAGQVLGVSAANIGGAGAGFQLTLRSLAGSGGNFDYNLVNALDLSANTTIATQIGNKTVAINPANKANTLGLYQSHIANYTADPAVLVNRQAVLRARTPLRGGAARNADGTYAGALLPACTGEDIGGWNDGSVFEDSPAYCAAHPPAT